MGCLASFWWVSDNSQEGMKNGCLRGSNESPHFTRPNSIPIDLEESSEVDGLEACGEAEGSLASSSCSSSF